MKFFLIGIAVTAAMLLGWEVGQWMREQWGYFVSLCSWVGIWAVTQMWLTRKKGG
jgi:hypothetical protein